MMEIFMSCFGWWLPGIHNYHNLSKRTREIRTFFFIYIPCIPMILTNRVRMTLKGITEFHHLEI